MIELLEARMAQGMATLKESRDLVTMIGEGVLANPAF